MALYCSQTLSICLGLPQKKYCGKKIITQDFIQEKSLALSYVHARYRKNMGGHVKNIPGFEGGVFLDIFQSYQL